MRPSAVNLNLCANDLFVFNFLGGLIMCSLFERFDLTVNIEVGVIIVFSFDFIGEHKVLLTKRADLVELKHVILRCCVFNVCVEIFERYVTKK